MASSFLLIEILTTFEGRLMVMMFSSPTLTRLKII